MYECVALHRGEDELIDRLCMNVWPCTGGGGGGGGRINIKC